MLNQACPSFKKVILEYFNDIYERNWYTEGKYTNLALEKFSEKSNIKNVLPVPNGTLGIFLAILSLDLPPKSKIIVPSFTFYGSVTPILFAGHIPVFADCCPETYQMKLDDIKSVYNKDVKALMTVPIYGQSLELEKIQNFVKSKNLKWIEDCAQSVGVFFNDKHLGSFGDVAIFSTFSDKSFSSGEGGLITAKEDRIFKNIKLLRNQGRLSSGTFKHDSLGMNFRITDMQGALMYEQFCRWEEIRSQRQVTWKEYYKLFKEIDIVNPQIFNKIDDSVPFRFAFTSKYKDTLEKIIQNSGISTRGFFMPMHLQPKMAEYRIKDLKNSEKLWKTGLALPIHQEVKEYDILKVARAINNATRNL